VDSGYYRVRVNIHNTIMDCNDPTMRRNNKLFLPHAMLLIGLPLSKLNVYPVINDEM